MKPLLESILSKAFHIEHLQGELHERGDERGGGQRGGSSQRSGSQWNGVGVGDGGGEGDDAVDDCGGGGDYFTPKEYVLFAFWLL